ncbi:Alpha/beta hydrolase family [Carex littledalei]|uniref:Alpha/beta hydrolase family n=1 Tax=Carex littledalei TaxID=544730 RepID=A0A833QX11_9POAL|nr:Alpha/beta hydrolase family [Carex littledalei]
MIASGISFARLLCHLRRLLHCLSIVYFHDLFISLFFIYNHLIPRTIHLSIGPTAHLTSIHIWTPLLHRRSKPTLVLIHGFGGDAKWQWHNQIRTLSRSFNLYIPDLIFFGNSRSNSPNRSVHFQAKCIAQAMKHLGLERYNIVGISYGGFVAYRMGLDVATKEVEKIVVLTSGVCASDGRRRELVQREGRDVREILCPLRPEDLRLLVLRTMHRPPVWMPDFYLRDFIEMKYMDQRKERVELLDELLSNGAGVNPLPVLSQETLLLWGDQDKAFGEKVEAGDNKGWRTCTAVGEGAPS